MTCLVVVTSQSEAMAAASQMKVVELRHGEGPSILDAWVPALLLLADDDGDL
jgi:hypothetical protein